MLWIQRKTHKYLVYVIMTDNQSYSNVHPGEFILTKSWILPTPPHKNMCEFPSLRGKIFGNAGAIFSFFSRKVTIYATKFTYFTIF